jgi:hypothetical protein
VCCRGILLEHVLTSFKASKASHTSHDASRGLHVTVRRCIAPGLMVAMLTLGFGAPAAAQAVKPAPRAPAAGHPLLGTWSWQLFNSRCVETYQYRPDGTLLSTSGESVNEWTYEVSPEADGKGFYKIVETSLRQNGKKDCSGDVVDKDGDIQVRYIQFSPARDLFLACQSASLSACFGPLLRVP